MDKIDRFIPLFSPALNLAIEGERRLWSRGIVFRDDDPRLVGELALKISSIEDAANAASEYNGFFSFALFLDGMVIAAVDRVRSFPLFWAIQDRTLYLGDDPYRIQETIGGRETDPIAFAELYLTGYVTSDSTFDPRIKQVPAGEILIARFGPTGNWEVRRQIYYRFHHHDEFEVSPEELLELGQKEMDEAVGRMIKVANGSKIVVPLSGGYDSRFILLTLKKLGHPDIAAFSYGLPGNSEAEVSRKVADTLGVPWHFVPYTPDNWAAWLRSPEWAEYQKFGERMTSVAHIQDWPAVWVLKEKGEFPKGTMFAPGHSGDFLAGKQIRPALLKRHGWNRAAVAKEIWTRHYTNTALEVARQEAGLGSRGRCLLWERTLNNLSGWEISTLEGANNAYDSEFWQEKLSKFIVNSMRVYEFWGYRWWLPFYDKDLVAFWERVPLKERMNEVFYRSIVEKLQDRYGITPFKAKNIALKKRIRQRISAPLVDRVIWRVYEMRRTLRNYILGILGAIPSNDFRKYLGRGGNINGYLAALHHRRYQRDGKLQ